MTGKKLVYIVSDIDKALHFEWISHFLKSNFNLSFILIGIRNSALEQFLRSEAIPVISIPYSRKIDLVRVWMKLFAILIKDQPDIIHTHLWIANLTGLTAGWCARITKRIYTRHHATVHYKDHPSGLKLDKMNNRVATQIIAVSKTIEHLLINCDKAQERKVRLIHHGFAFSYFQNIDQNRIDRLYEKHHINKAHQPIVGVISRFVEWKGIQFTIQAFEKLRTVFPQAHLILANARGIYEATLAQRLSNLPASTFTRIDFEGDLAALYRLFDVFVHVPVDAESEAFGQTYVEPLIVGIPCIFTLSGVAREFVVHEHNALVVDFKDPEQIHQGIVRILSDSTLRDSLVKNGKASVAGFTIEKYLDSLKDLYLE